MAAIINAVSGGAGGSANGVQSFAGSAGAPGIVIVEF